MYGFCFTITSFIYLFIYLIYLFICFYIIQFIYNSITWVRLKNMLVCNHTGLFFRVLLAGRKNFFYHFEMEKIALILIYNIFVTKKTFFRNEYQKKFLTLTFLVDPVRWRQTNVFLSLVLRKVNNRSFRTMCEICSKLTL